MTGSPLSFYRTRTGSHMPVGDNMVMWCSEKRAKTLTGSAAYNTHWISQVEIPGKLEWSGRWKQNAAPNPLIKNSFLLFVQWDKTVLCTVPSFFGKSSCLLTSSDGHRLPPRLGLRASSRRCSAVFDGLSHGRSVRPGSSPAEILGEGLRAQVI